MSSPKIRPATPADADEIVAMIRELAEYERLLHEVRITPDDLRAALFGERPAAEAIVAWTEANEVAGFALYFTSFSTFVGKPGLYLEDLYVRPQHRGRGLGKRLFGRVGAIARERGCGRYEWEVLDWNQPARDFYHSWGAELHPDWRRMRMSGEALERFAPYGA